MRIEWTQAALTDMAEMETYLLREAPDYTFDVAKRIWDAAKSLTRLPSRGRPGRIARSKELLVSGLPFILVYAIEGDEIFILRMLHQRREWLAD